MQQYVIETENDGTYVITRHAPGPGMDLRLMRATPGHAFRTLEVRLTDVERLRLIMQPAPFAPPLQYGDGHNPACSPYCQGDHPTP